MMKWAMNLLIFIIHQDLYADLMLGEYVETLREKGIDFRFDDAACRYLAEKSCNGQSGARDLRNLIRKEVEDKITEQMILHGEGGISAISLSADSDTLTVETI